MLSDRTLMIMLFSCRLRLKQNKYPVLYSCRLRLKQNKKPVLYSCRLRLKQNKYPVLFSCRLKLKQNKYPMLFSCRLKLKQNKYPVLFSCRLRLKQNKYPVLFLTQADTSAYESYNDRRTHSVKTATEFCLAYELLVSYVHCFSKCLMSLSLSFTKISDICN